MGEYSKKHRAANVVRVRRWWDGYRNDAAVSVDATAQLIQEALYAAKVNPAADSPPVSPRRQ